MAKRRDCAVPGIIVIDKPKGLTSHDVVARVRRLAHTRRVGHAGTLDPMATGILIVGVGTATRLLTWITAHTKTYEATIRFGAATLSDDADGELVEARGCENLSEDTLESAIGCLRGDILQVPSKVSAKKINGERAYALVRKGHEVELEAKPVSILRFERTSQLRAALQDTPAGTVKVVDVDVEVECSAGTYIRALARDLGVALGCGAHLIALRRTRVSNFGLDRAWSLAELEALAAEALSSAPQEPPNFGTPAIPGRGEEPTPAPGLIPLDEAVAQLLPTVVLDPHEAKSFSHGQAPRRRDEEIAPLRAHSAILGALDESGRALGLLDASGPHLSTVSVFVGA